MAAVHPIHRSMALNGFPCPRKGDHFPDGLLLGFVRDQFAALATPETEGDFTA
jgi:hypothetical protein